MSETPKFEPMGLGIEAPAALQKMWIFLVGMGIALMILGFAAIGSTLVATIATVLLFGVLLFIGAILQIVTAIWARSWKGFSIHLLAGILYFIAGMFMIDTPVEAALALTLVVATSLLVGGILRIIMALMDRFHGWEWVLLNGVVSVALGLSIWKQWPFSGLWVIGLFVGIELLFSGMSWVMLGLALRSGTKAMPAN